MKSNIPVTHCPRCGCERLIPYNVVEDDIYPESKKKRRIKYFKCGKCKTVFEQKTR